MDIEVEGLDEKTLIEKKYQENIEYYKSMIQSLNPSLLEQKMIDLFCQSMYQLQMLSSSNPKTRSDSLPLLEKNLAELAKIEIDENVLVESKLCKEVFENLSRLILKYLSSLRWEDKSAALHAVQILTNEDCDMGKDFEDTMIKHTLELLKHPENRIREESAETLSTYCKVLKVELYQQIEPKLIGLFETCLEPFKDNDSYESDKMAEEGAEQVYRYNSQKGSCLEPVIRTLEKSLKKMKDADSAIQLGKENIENLLTVSQKSMHHIAKHIRTASAELIINLCEILSVSDILQFEQQVAEIILVGISDNMIDPRFASEKAAGSFFDALKRGNSDAAKYHKKFIPRLCFNRLVAAKSFSDKSIDIWKKVVEGKGAEILNTFSAESLHYYLQQSNMENWEIRETACKGIDEIFKRILPKNPSTRMQLLGNMENMDKQMQRLLTDPHINVRIAATEADKSISLAMIKEKPERVQHSFLLLRSLLNSCAPDEKASLAKSMVELCKANQELIALHKEYIANLIARPFKVHSHGDKHHEDLIIESPEDPYNKHIHVIDMMLGIVEFTYAYTQEFLNTKPEDVDFFLKQFFEKLHSVRHEHYEKSREWVYKNLLEINKKIGKDMAKKHIDSYLETLSNDLRRIFQGKYSSTGRQAKDLMNSLVNTIGENIIKGRINNLDDGKFTRDFPDWVSLLKS